MAQAAVWNKTVSLLHMTEVNADPFSVGLVALASASCILILSVNVGVIRVVLQESTSTLINKFIILDCVISLANIPIIAKLVKQTIAIDWFCVANLSYITFITCINRVIPLAILSFR